MLGMTEVRYPLMHFVRAGLLDNGLNGVHVAKVNDYQF